MPNGPGKDVGCRRMPLALGKVIVDVNPRIFGTVVRYALACSGPKIQCLSVINAFRLVRSRAALLNEVESATSRQAKAYRTTVPNVECWPFATANGTEF
jgi:hypothetical protein